MKLLHAIPAYRQSVKVQLLPDALATFAECDRVGDQYGFHFVDIPHVARARNLIVRAALAGGVDLLLMQDADVYGTMEAPVYRYLRETLIETGAAAVGAAVAMRNVDRRLNCRPAHVNDVYPGEVGTGIMLIDIRQLRDLPLPWFEYELTPDGTGCATGEDISFCRLLLSRGYKVIVDSRAPTTHVADLHIAYPGGIA